MTSETIELIQGKKGIELPVETGNWVLLKEEGYSPIQTLVASVGSCGAYVYQSILNKSHIPYKFEKTIVTYTRDSERQSHPVNSIAIHFELSVPLEFQERANRSLKLIKKNCPVIQSLDTEINIVETATFK